MTSLHGQLMMLCAQVAALVVLAGFAAACDSANASAPVTASTGYFGDQHAAAQRALVSKPAEEPAPTF